MYKSTNVKSQQELLMLLKKCERELDKEKIYYLKALIRLKMSIVNDEYISQEDRLRLSLLPIYSLVGRYNIYIRALNLLDKNGIPYHLANKGNRLSIYDGSTPIYGFEFKTDNRYQIGSISLYHNPNPQSIVNAVHGLFLEEYSLTLDEKESEEEQVLIKTAPGLKITNNFLK